jgi:hypothetical protein
VRAGFRGRAHGRREAPQEHLPRRRGFGRAAGESVRFRTRRRGKCAGSRRAARASNARLIRSRATPRGARTGPLGAGSRRPPQPPRPPRRRRRSAAARGLSPRCSSLDPKPEIPKPEIRNPETRNPETRNLEPEPAPGAGSRIPRGRSRGASPPPPEPATRGATRPASAHARPPPRRAAGSPAAACLATGPPQALRRVRLVRGEGRGVST